MKPLVPGRRSLRTMLIAATAILLSAGATWAQAPLKPGDKVLPPKSLRPLIPVVKITPRPISDDSPVIPRIGKVPGAPPGSVSPSERDRLLRDSGVDFRVPRAPTEFRLSPRDPYVSNAAYLVFIGNVQFSSASNQLFLSLPDTSSGYRLPQPAWPEWLTGGRRKGGPQPDPPGLVAVRIRIDGPARYLADFSVSAENSTTYKLRMTGAEGSGNFPKPAGAHHVFVVIEASGSGYAQIDCWADRSFTFHNVLVTKLD